MISDVRIFRDGDNLYIEGFIESVQTSSICFISTVRLRKKDTLYIIKADKKLVFAPTSMEDSPNFKGWKSYVLTLKDVCYLNSSSSVTGQKDDSKLKINPTTYSLIEGLEYVETRDKLNVKELTDLIAPLGRLDARYILDSNSGVELEVSMFGEKSPYEFLFENVSKTGMLLSCDYAFVPFDKSTVVTVKVSFKNSNYNLYDIMVAGKIAKIFDWDVAGGQTRKFIGINLTKSSDVKSWTKFISYLKELSFQS